MIVSPQCPKDEWWSIDALHDLLNEIVETYRIDTARIYVTGLSMGGYATWGLACTYPEAARGRRSHLWWWGSRKSALNEGNPNLGFPRRKRRGCAVCNNLKRWFDALKAAGSDVRFTVYPEGGHVEAWQNAYGRSCPMGVVGKAATGRVKH